MIDANRVIQVNFESMAEREDNRIRFFSFLGRTEPSRQPMHAVRMQRKHRSVRLECLRSADRSLRELFEQHCWFDVRTLPRLVLRRCHSSEELRAVLLLAMWIDTVRSSVRPMPVQTGCDRSQLRCLPGKSLRLSRLQRRGLQTLCLRSGKYRCVVRSVHGPMPMQTGSWWQVNDLECQKGERSTWIALENAIRVCRVTGI